MIYSTFCRVKLIEIQKIFLWPSLIYIVRLNKNVTIYTLNLKRWYFTLKLWKTIRTSKDEFFKSKKDEILKSKISPFLELKNSPFKARIVFHIFRVKFHLFKFRVYIYESYQIFSLYRLMHFRKMEFLIFYFFIQRSIS